MTYDANGNLTADGSGNTFVYDVRVGVIRVVVRRTADGSGNTFVYDAWNRLVAVKNGGVTAAAYGYNGQGERITETHGTTTTDLYYDASWEVVEERVNGQLQARNVWSAAAVDMMVLRDQSSQGNGVLDQRLYVQQDANGNVTAVLDIHGNVLEHYVYQPYGAVTVLTAAWMSQGTSAYGWMYLWQGKRYDGAVGLYDSRGRVYSPSLGRPLQADPLGLAPDPRNDYRWEGNGPTDRTDPSGLMAPGPIFVRRPHGWRPPPPAPFNWDAGLKTGAGGATGCAVGGMVFPPGGEIVGGIIGFAGGLVWGGGSQGGQRTNNTTVVEQGLVIGSFPALPYILWEYATPAIAAAWAYFTTHPEAVQNEPQIQDGLEQLTFYRGDQAGLTEFLSHAAQIGGQGNSEEILANGDLDQLMAQHALDSSNPPSPFISVTTDPNMAPNIRRFRWFSLRTPIGAGTCDSESV